MHGKGQTGFSFVKHLEFERLALMQAAIAARLLRPNASIAIIDPNAADGEGVLIGDRRFQPFLPLGQDFGDLSRPTPLIAAKAALIFARHGFDPLVLWCERSKPLREKLEAALPVFRERLQWTGRCEILANNALLLNRPLTFDYALAIVDPNGPRDAAIDVLIRIASSSTKADFVILVNESGIVRPANLKDQPHTRAQREAGIRYLQHLEPEFWLRTLGRRFAVERIAPFEGRGMKGRLFLVTNYYGQHCPHGYEVFERATVAFDRAASVTSRQSAHSASRRSGRADREPTFL